MRIFTVMLAASVVAGCQSVDYAMENYNKIEPVQFVILPETGPRFAPNPTTGTTQDRAKTYRIFDKPAESRLLITASTNDAVATGFASGMFYGAVRMDSPAVVYRDAAERWLVSLGRPCKANDVSEVMQTMYEVRYTCAPLDGAT